MCVADSALSLTTPSSLIVKSAGCNTSDLRNPRTVPALSAAAKLLVLVRRLWVSLVVDILAAVAQSNADHMLARAAQPLALGRLGVVQIILRSSPPENDLARRIVDARTQLGRAGRRRDPAAPASAMAVAKAARA
jgi:hypothetical protein